MTCEFTTFTSAITTSLDEEDDDLNIYSTKDEELLGPFSTFAASEMQPEIVNRNEATGEYDTNHQKY